MSNQIFNRNGRPVQKDLVKIGVLWEKQSKKDDDKVYYIGRLGEATLLMFEIESDNPRAPMFSLYVGEPLGRNNPPLHRDRQDDADYDLIDEDPPEEDSPDGKELKSVSFGRLSGDGRMPQM